MSDELSYLKKEIHAPREIALESSEEKQKDKFAHQLVKLQGDKKEYFDKRRLKAENASAGIVFETRTKHVSTGKFSFKAVKERKLKLSEKRLERNASDKYRRLTKKCWEMAR